MAPQSQFPLVPHAPARIAPRPPPLPTFSRQFCPTTPLPPMKQVVAVHFAFFSCSNALGWCGGSVCMACPVFPPPTARLNRQEFIWEKRRGERTRNKVIPNCPISAAVRLRLSRTQQQQRRFIVSPSFSHCAEIDFFCYANFFPSFCMWSPGKPWIIIIKRSLFFSSCIRCNDTSVNVRSLFEYYF